MVWTWKKVRSASDPIPDPIGPVSKLSFRSTWVSPVKLYSCVGRGPSSRLKFMSRTSRLVSAPISVGRIPPITPSSRDRTLSPVSWLSSLGRDPARPLDSKKTVARQMSR